MRLRADRCHLSATWLFTLVLATAGAAHPGAARGGTCPAIACAGDCDGSGDVDIGEIVKAVNMALGQAVSTPCLAVDASCDGAVSINELIQAVNNALNGCPAVDPSPTPTPTFSIPTSTPSPPAPTDTPSPTLTATSSATLTATAAASATVASATATRPTVTATVAPTATRTLIAGGECVTTIPGGSVALKTWTAAESPYCVTGNLGVSQLTIEPGVTVLVDGPYEIEVQTTLTAEGTEEAPIIFSSKNAAVRWRGLRFQNTPGGSHFAHCLIERSERSGVTLQNAVAPQFDHCVFRNNTVAGNGGAINATGVAANLVLQSCAFIGNQATAHGGALRVQMAEGFSLQVSDTLFENNVANPAQANGDFVGGALYLTGDAAIMNSLFSGNRSNSRCTGGNNCKVTARGGAIFADGGLIIDKCVLKNNRSHASYEALYCGGGTRNSFGGGFYASSGSVTITNSTVSCNSVTGSGSCTTNKTGGGFCVNGGTVTVRNSTVARNSDGPAVTRAAGTLNVDSSIVYFNNADGAQTSGSMTVTFSDVQNGLAGEGNVNFNPAFVGRGCDAADFQIALGSPAIDMGNPDAALDDACTPPGLGGTRNDMGVTGGPGNCGL